MLVLDHLSIYRYMCIFMYMYTYVMYGIKLVAATPMTNNLIGF